MSPSTRHVSLWAWLTLGSSLYKYVVGQEELIIPKVPFPALECNNHGYRDPDDIRSCVCFNGWTGYDCSRLECPKGRAWVDYATAADTAHADEVECSNAGFCDYTTGFCKCRSGFWGSACDRLECPDECNGHGQCLSMREAASMWNGRNLVVPYATYNNWDADMIYGCVCDEGYAGYDCSLVECPRGDNPVTTGQQDEVLVIECTATQGSFLFHFNGYTSRVIPFNQTYGVLQERLLELPSVSALSLSMTSQHACSASTERVTIHLTQDFGSLPPARVTPLSLVDGTTGGAGQLYMVTQSQLTCSACPSCAGGFYLGFLDVWTNLIPWNATIPQLEVALRQLRTLTGVAAVYGTLLVNATALGTISGHADGILRVCDPSSTSYTRIELRGEFGNLPDLQLINSVIDSTTGNLKTVNMSSNKGTKENVYCSNHGICDFESGTCLCFQSRALTYFWETSDGYGEAGPRGDCGYPKVTPSACPYACNGRGDCDADFTCSCFDPYDGPDCSFIKCPKGRAWFDEANNINKAHAPEVECSNRGICDNMFGFCMCQEGFTGLACEELACPEKDGLACSGHGRCLSMRRLAELGDLDGDATTFSYGSRDNGYSNFDATWDADMVHGCHCDLHSTNGPYAGPLAQVSGVTVINPKLMGYGGYDCSRRLCPTGDDAITPGVAEKQTLTCTRSSGTFTLTFRQQTTAPIAFDASAADVQQALEDLTTIGSVQVAISSSSVACSAGGTAVAVTFLTELGDVPLMTASPSMTVVETIKGSREDNECSSRGYCDYGSGSCACLEGYGSSDGAGNVGVRGDCGALNVYPPHLEVTSQGGVSVS